MWHSNVNVGATRQSDYKICWNFKQFFENGTTFFFFLDIGPQLKNETKFKKKTSTTVPSSPPRDYGGPHDRQRFPPVCLPLLSQNSTVPHHNSISRQQTKNARSISQRFQKNLLRNGIVTYEARRLVIFWPPSIIIVKASNARI